MDEQTADVGALIRERVRVLRDGKLLILVCVVLTVTATVLFSAISPKQYRASGHVLIHRSDLGQSVGLGGAPQGDEERRSATDLELVSQPVLAQRVVDKLKLPGSAEDLVDKVEGKARGNSSLIAIEVTDEGARRTTEIANAYAREYVAFRAESDRRRIGRALANVRGRIRSLEQGGVSTLASRRLRGQAQDLELFRSLEVGDADVIQQARVPTTPVSPKPLRNALLGGVFGLLLGAGLAFLRERLDRRVKREEDVRSLFPEVPVVALLPEQGKGGEAAREVEEFRTLRTNMAFLQGEEGLRSLLITSSGPGDGKSTISLNLALAMAEREEDVILVEADLRRRGLSKRLRLEGLPGVSNVLSDGGGIEDYLHDVSITGASGGNGRSRAAALSGVVTVLPAGPTPPNPQALLSRPKLEELLSEADQRADRVVIDGTPIGPLSDMLPLARRVDGVLVVVRLYHSRRDELRRLIEQLRQAGVQPIGLVLVTPRSQATYSEYM